MTGRVKVTIRHVRALYMCTRGARRWCNRYGLDWREFLRHGIPVELLRQSGDAQAIALCDLAEAEANEQRRR
jgi:hypothetical protein